MQFMLPVTFAFDDATVRPEDAPALERFAQVVVNRLWARFMGRGLVEPAPRLDAWIAL